MAYHQEKGTSWGAWLLILCVLWCALGRDCNQQKTQRTDDLQQEPQIIADVQSSDLPKITAEDPVTGELAELPGGGEAVSNQLEEAETVQPSREALNQFMDLLKQSGVREQLIDSLKKQGLELDSNGVTRSADDQLVLFLKSSSLDSGEQDPEASVKMAVDEFLRGQEAPINVQSVQWNIGKPCNLSLGSTNTEQ